MTTYDTNIIIDYFKGEKEANEIIKKTLDERGIGLSVISCYELLRGAFKSEEEAIKILFSRVNIYLVDLNAARIAGELYKESKARGTELNMADTLILATAKANDEVFVTQDSGFAGMYEKVIILSRRK